MTVTRQFSCPTQIPRRLDMNPPGYKASMKKRRHTIILLIMACLCVSTHAAETSSTEEIIELIDQGQRHNRSLPVPGQAFVTFKRDISEKQIEEIAASYEKQNKKPLPKELEKVH